jgi:hypothetical protein
VNRVTNLLKSTRLWGLAGTAVILYVVVFVVLGKLDMSWIMPNTQEIARTFISVWPRLPFFQVEQESVKLDGGTNQYIYYTVPTRQFTKQELTRMGVTNAVVHPEKPK